MGLPRRADALGAGGGAVAGLLAAAGVLLALGAGPGLIAPLGATSVLVYAAPNSPLAQPFSAVVGNAVSALVALGVASVLPAGPWLAPVAVGLAIAVMLGVRALHPPGGAVALLVALQPSWSLAQAAVAGTLVLVAVALGWNRLVGRVYPFRQPLPGPHGTADPAPQTRLGLDPAELTAILEDYRQSANVGTADLARLIGAAEEAAAARRLERFTCADVMSRDLVTVAPGAPLAEVLRLFAAHGFSSLPVVREGGVLAGVVLQIDVIRALARPRRIGRSRGTAGEVMQANAPRALAETPVGALLPMLSDGGREAVPITEGDRIVGIVTRTDLISALARRLARDYSPRTPGSSSFSSSSSS